MSLFDAAVDLNPHQIEAALFTLACLAIESLVREEHRLFSGFDDEGRALDPETMEKLLGPSGRVGAELRAKRGLQSAATEGCKWTGVKVAIRRPPRCLLAAMKPGTIIPRLVEARLKEALADSPVVLIHGPRQCGRTTLAHRVGRDRTPGRFLLTGSANVLLVPQLAKAAGKRFTAVVVHDRPPPVPG